MPFPLCTFPHQSLPCSTVQREAVYCHSGIQSAFHTPTVLQHIRLSEWVRLPRRGEPIPSAFSASEIRSVPVLQPAFSMSNIDCWDQPVNGGTYSIDLFEIHGTAHDGSFRKGLFLSAGDSAVSFWESKTGTVFPEPYRKFTYPQWQDGDLE